jgi:hypothetical protein
MSTFTEDDSSEETMAPQAAPARTSSAQAQDALQQFQASLSQFLQGNQRNQEGLNRLMDQPNLQLLKFEQKIEDLETESKRTRDLIRNYRQ